MTTGRVEISSPHMDSTCRWFFHLDGMQSMICFDKPRGRYFRVCPETRVLRIQQRSRVWSVDHQNQASYFYGRQKLTIFSDSQLVFHQIQGDFEAKADEMANLVKAKALLSTLKDVKIKQVPRSTNYSAYQLAKLASSITSIKSRNVTFLSSNILEIE